MSDTALTTGIDGDERAAQTFPRLDDEMAQRKADWKGPRPTDYASGALWKYAQLVGVARLGAVTHPGAKAETHVYMDQ